MVIDEIKHIKSGRKELRDFGIVMAVALLVITAIFYFRHGVIYTYLLYISSLLLMLGILVPIILLPFHKIWMSLAITIGWVVSRPILSILFYIVFTITGLLGRLFGKRFLDLKIDKNAESYWIPRKIGDKKPNYEKQF